MEFIPKVIKTQNEAIPKPEAVRIMPTVYDFAKEIAKEVDKAFIKVMDEKIGPGWKPELLEVVKLPEIDCTMPYARFELLYAGETVGRIRQSVAVQGNKTIGNIFVDMEEKNK